MNDWSDGYWTTEDGLRLHYRDYPGRDDRPPILCIPGLTRNARDFEGVADRLKGDWRLVCVELRGRGQSEYAKDAMSYSPPVYWRDVEALVAGLGIGRFVLFGTSLGGLITMLMAMAEPKRIAEPFRQPGGDTGFDLWTAFAALKGIPSLVVHGELSDLLSGATVERMLAENPAMEAVTVPRVGHAPTLDEPEVAEAIDRLLGRVSTSS